MALQQELALVGDDDHFWCTAIAAGQGLYLVDDADVVMAEDAYQLFGRKMCSASGHKLLTIDYCLLIIDYRFGSSLLRG